MGRWLTQGSALYWTGRVESGSLIRIMWSPTPTICGPKYHNSVVISFKKRKKEAFFDEGLVASLSVGRTDEVYRGQFVPSNIVHVNLRHTAGVDGHDSKMDRSGSSSR